MMLRALIGAILLSLGGLAMAADLEISPRPADRPQSVAPVQPAQPPVPLQSTEPGRPPLPEPAPIPEQKPADTLEPPPGDTAIKDGSWWQSVVRAAPNCKSFSDGCRTCSPNFDCSGLPIACQPKEFRCIDPKP